MNLSTPARRLLLLAAPATLGIVSIWHPVAPGDSPYSIVAQSPTWWTILHLIQLPLFGLLALSVALLIRGLPSRTALVSRIALGVFVVFYTALDSVTGIASGIIVREARHLPEHEQAVVEPLVNSLFLGGGPYTIIPALGVVSWVVAMMAAAMALSRAGVSRLPVGLLGVAAVAFGITHEPPFGPVGMAAFVLAVASIELAPGRFWRSCPVPDAARPAVIPTRDIARDTQPRRAAT